MIRVLLLATLTGPTLNLPVPNAKIYFPDENIPIDPRGSYTQHTGQSGQHSYNTKSSHRKGGYESPIQWPPAVGGSGQSYGDPGHHVSYSSYGHHPHPQHLSYSSYSYGSHPHTFHRQSHSYEGSQSHGSGGGSVEGLIEQTSHGNHGSSGGSVEGLIEQTSHGNHGYSGGSVEGLIEQTSHGNHGSSGGSVEGLIEQTSHGNHGSSGGSVEGLIEQTSHGNHDSDSVDTYKHTVNGQETGDHASHDNRPDYGMVEANQNHESNSHHAHGNSRPSYGQVKIPSAAEVAAEEHHIIQEIEQLVGLTNPPDGITKNPITQQQEIMREINGLKDLQHQEPVRREDSAAESGLGQEVTIPPVRHYEREQELQEREETDSGLGPIDHETTVPPKKHYERIPEEPQHSYNEVQAPMVQATPNQGSQGAGHHVIHTEVHRSHHQSFSNTKAKPDPLDLTNIYNDYVQGDFKPGHAKETPQQPKKELKPEIKQAIDNIMREWEVIPENEGKPQPPPRNYKITKHVKVTTTTHNHPVLVQPSQTITKTVHTHTFQPTSNHGSTHHRQVIKHINIAELLEQLSKLESSPHHRNVTWCEEKIKEFLTELNRKEENGVEINQSVQEETLHHILTQDQTITKEVHHEMEHEVNAEVEEPPFVKKTVVELGQNEPTRPPSYWVEQEAKSETHSIAPGHVQENGSVDVEEEKKNELPETRYETSEEPQIVTVTPSPHNIHPLEALSHQSHASENENNPSSEDGGETHGSDSEAPLTPKSEQPGKAEIEEFRGDTEREERPLPPGYKPRERSEEENEIENETNGIEEPKEDHTGIDDLSIELPQLPQSEFSHEGKDEEHKSDEITEREDTDEGPNQQHVEHVIHELNNGDHSVGKTEYILESEHQQTGDSNGQIGNVTVENSEQSSGSRVEQVEETVDHTGGNHGHIGGGINTQYVEETIHHSTGGSHGHSGGGSQTEYVEETVEHHQSEGHNEINYDQLIEELISLESLPGHQAIDKCEEKIRHFLEVLRKQQERGFDQNQAELQRLRLLLQEIQAQKQNQSVNPQSSEATNSFWKKVGRKIKTTFEKAKTKAHNTVNGLMNN